MELAVEQEVGLYYVEVFTMCGVELTLGSREASAEVA